MAESCFMLEEKNHGFSSTKVMNFMILKDLIKCKPGDVVKDNFMVNVKEVKDTTKTKTGTPYKKYLIADDNASIRMTNAQVMGVPSENLPGNTKCVINVVLT